MGTLRSILFLRAQKFNAFSYILRTIYVSLLIYGPPENDTLINSGMSGLSHSHHRGVKYLLKNEAWVCYLVGRVTRNKSLISAKYDG